jgi:hypothetical protein
MPIWTKTKPPVHAPQCKASPRGWQDPISGEIFVAIRQLAVKAGPGTIREVFFSSMEPLENEPFSVTVVFSEAVNVEAGAELEVENSDGPNVSMVASEQLNVTRAVFEAVAPEFPAVLSVPAQTIDGVVTDADLEGANANLDISANVASAAGSANVVEVP